MRKSRSDFREDGRLRSEFDLAERLGMTRTELLLNISEVEFQMWSIRAEVQAEEADEQRAMEG